MVPMVLTLPVVHFFFQMSQNVKYMQANNIDDIQWFDVEYDIHFTSEIGCSAKHH